MKLYIVVNEWHYPDDSGATTIDCVYNDEEEAKDCANGYAEAERAVFAAKCGDPTQVEEMQPTEEDPFTAFVMSCKNGLDPWWYAARVVSFDSISDVRI